MYNYLDMLESLATLWGISDIYDLFMTSQVSDFYVILQLLATANVIQCVETLYIHLENVFDRISQSAKFDV